MRVCITMLMHKGWWVCEFEVWVLVVYVWCITYRHVAGQRLFRGIPQSSHDWGGKCRCWRADLTVCVENVFLLSLHAILTHSLTNSHRLSSLSSLPSLSPFTHHTNPNTYRHKLHTLTHLHLHTHTRNPTRKSSIFFITITHHHTRSPIHSLIHSKKTYTYKIDLFRHGLINIQIFLVHPVHVHFTLHVNWLNQENYLDQPHGESQRCHNFCESHL